jgi:hypothetical protein
MQGTKDQEDKPAPAHAPSAAQDGITAAPNKAPPVLSAAKQAEKARLAEALRANLRRRKAQTRQRRAETPESPGSDED